MKAIFLLPLFLVSLLSAPLAAASSPQKILFIGNSLTYGNSLPSMFEAMANADHKQPQVEVANRISDLRVVLFSAGHRVDLDILEKVSLGREIV